MADKQDLYPGNEVYNYVASKIHWLENAEPAEAKANLALLRRAAGKQLSEVPDVWGMVLEELPDSLLRNTRGPSAAEEAIFLSLKNYGMAMQGHEAKSDSVQEKGVSLGAAAGLYSKKYGEEESRIFLRLKKVVVSDSLAALEVPLRSMIKLMSHEPIKMDYAKLAEDLYEYSFPKGRERVRLKWARDYYRTIRASEKKEKDDTAKQDSGEQKKTSE